MPMSLPMDKYIAIDCNETSTGTTLSLDMRPDDAAASGLRTEAVKSTMHLIRDVVAKTPVAASAALWLLILSAPCLAQGGAIPYEIRGVEAVVEVMGESPLVRGALERLLGRSAAEAVLALPPKELGWKVIETDAYASAVATAPALREAGNTDAFLASINDLRAFRAQTMPGQKTFNLLSMNNSSPDLPEMIRPVTVEHSVTPPSESTKWEFTFTREGIKVDPGYKIPLWESSSTTGNIKIDEIKWSDVGVACAIISPCANEISDRLKKIVTAATPAIPQPVIPQSPSRKEPSPSPEFRGAPSEERSLEVVRAFYTALGKADGGSASKLVIPEKRTKGAFAAPEITRFYSSLARPLRLVGTTPSSVNVVEVQYQYASPQGRPCQGRAVVNLVVRGDELLIDSIQAREHC